MFPLIELVWKKSTEILEQPILDNKNKYKIIFERTTQLLLLCSLLLLLVFIVQNDSRLKTELKLKSIEPFKKWTQRFIETDGLS